VCETVKTEGTKQEPEWPGVNRGQGGCLQIPSPPTEQEPDQGGGQRDSRLELLPLVLIHESEPGPATVHYSASGSGMIGPRANGTKDIKQNGAHMIVPCRGRAVIMRTYVRCA
jgi:hypothetical protein